MYWEATAKFVMWVVQRARELIYQTILMIFKVLIIINQSFCAQNIQKLNIILMQKKQFYKLKFYILFYLILF